MSFDISVYNSAIGESSTFHVEHELVTVSDWAEFFEQFKEDSDSSSVWDEWGFIPERVEEGVFYAASAPASYWGEGHTLVASAAPA